MGTKWKHWLPSTLVVLISGGVALMSIACAAIGAPPSGSAIALMKKSQNYKEDLFVNGISVKDIPFFKALKEWVRSSSEHTVPLVPVPVMKRDRKDFSNLPKSGLRITWVGHSTTLVEIDGVRLLLDPIWSERSSPFSRTGPKRFHMPPVSLDDLPPIDAVLISHDHYDHLDMDTVVYLGGKGYRFIVPLGVGARLQSWDISTGQIEELDWWENTKVGKVTVTATPARHFSGRRMNADRDETLWAGFAMMGDAHRVYYTGDTGMFPDFIEIGKRLGPFDAALVEIGSYNQLWADIHLGPEQAVQAAMDVESRLLIPVHWATFNLAFHSWVEPAERVIISAAKQNVPLAIPKPGQSVEPPQLPPLIRWWPKVPWETEQQHPIVSSGLTSK